MSNNTGDRNTGNWNTGDWNTGNWNTGNRNTGYRNTGNLNTGNLNTGDCNAGNWNTGYRNIGYRNTGGWNTGDCNTGSFNTETPKMTQIFNKDIPWEDFLNISYPDWLHFDLTHWVYEENMTDEEKENNPTFKTTGGYLKKLSYKEAARISWDEASMEDKKHTLNIPNFDNDIMIEIFGIDVEAELNQNSNPKTISIDLTQEQLDKIKKAGLL
jgi:hypothetical protein